MRFWLRSGMIVVMGCLLVGCEQHTSVVHKRHEFSQFSDFPYGHALNTPPPMNATSEGVTLPADLQTDRTVSSAHSMQQTGGQHDESHY